MDNQIVIYVLLGALVLLFAITAYGNARNAQNASDVIAALQKSVNDIATNPLYNTLAKGLAESVPMDTFNAVYKRADGVQATIGENTPSGQLLKRVEDYFKSIDSDPSNDPATVAANAVDAVKQPIYNNVALPQTHVDG